MFDSFKRVVFEELLPEATKKIIGSDKKYIEILLKFFKQNNINVEDQLKNQPFNTVDYNVSKEIDNSYEERSGAFDAEKDYEILFSRLENIHKNMINLENLISSN